MKEDDVLITQFLDGDKEAFAMIINKYQNRLLNITYGVLGNDREAEDVVQEAFIKAYRGLASFNRKSQFYSWLYRITLNTCYDVLRKRRRLTLYPDFHTQPSPAGNNTLDNLAQQEHAQLLHRAINQLPVKLRTVLILKEFENLSYKEIARIVGCRIGTVESRLFRARERLRRILVPQAEHRHEKRGDQ